MTITASANLKARMAAGTTTLARLYVITRTDGIVYRFTDHDVDIVYDGNTYSAEASILMSAVYGTIGGTTQSSEALIAFDNSFISEVDVINGFLDFAGFDVYLIDYNNTGASYGVMTIFSGNVGAIENTHKGFARVELRGKLHKANYVIGEAYMPECRADLADSRCGVDPATILDSITVDTVTTATSLFAGTISQTLASGYFSLGLLVWTSGNNNGLKMEIASSGASGTTQTIRLTLPMPFAIEVGDTANIYAGCDKRLTTCHTKFNNALNFRGEPAKPGADWVNGYVAG